MSSTKQYRLAFDLDDVLCFRNYNDNVGIKKYHHCQPIQKMIDNVNKLYDDGHTIIIYTARGMNQFNGRIHEIYDKLYGLTKNQLDSWGVKHHQLVMGKVHYDLLVDDKAVSDGAISDYEDVYTAVHHARVANNKKRSA